MHAGAPLAEGGWGERSNMLEPPLGGGAGELCVKACRPQAGFNGKHRSSASNHHTHAGRAGSKDPR
jgi:hypothetical protein